MKEENFQQKRIVQLSKELDAEREKYFRLAKQCSQLNNRIKENQSEIEEYKEKLIEFQINNHQLQERVREMEREIMKSQDQLEKEQKMRSQAEVDNVRQRQLIDDLRQEMTTYQNKSKSILYERTSQIAEKDKEIYRLKEENIQIEKLYLNERDRLQRKEEKNIRDYASLYKEFESVRRQLAALKTQSQKNIQNERVKLKRDTAEVFKKIEQLQSRLRKQEQLEEQIQQLKLRLEEVVIENSQKIIQLYRYKYAK